MWRIGVLLSLIGEGRKTVKHSEQGHLVIKGGSLSGNDELVRRIVEARRSRRADVEGRRERLLVEGWQEIC